MQRWTKWLHTTKLLLESAWMYFTVKDLWIIHATTCMNPTYIPQDTLKSNQTFIVFLLLLKWVLICFFVVLVVLFLLLLFFLPNQRVLKTVLENIPRGLQPSFKKREKKKKEKEGTSVVFFCSGKYPKSLLLG